MHLPVKFGVSTWLWTSPFTSESTELFPHIKRMGYDAVEIALEDPALVDGKVVAKALKENELDVVVCGAFGPTRDLTSDDLSLQKNSFAYMEACFQFCGEVGGSFLAGPMYSAVGKARLATPEQRKIEWNRAVDNLYKVCVSAQSQGLRIALEPLNRFESDLVNTADDVMRLINDINHPAACVLLDGFHMNIEEKDLEAAVVRAGDKLIHVQVSENYRGTPGTGQTRWDSLRRGLESVAYQGVVTIESFTPNVKELAGAVCIWKPLAASQDAFAIDGIGFLKKWAS